MPMRFLLEKVQSHTNGGQVESICDLRIWLDVVTGASVVIVTERADNPGASITVAAEALATRVCREQRLDPQQCTWIERYVEPATAAKPAEAYYSRATYQWEMITRTAFFPQWEPLSLAQVADLIGEPPPPIAEGEGSSR